MSKKTLDESLNEVRILQRKDAEYDLELFELRGKRNIIDEKITDIMNRQELLKGNLNDAFDELKEQLK